MHQKKTVILAQILISGMMAFCMTGTFSFLQEGATYEWIGIWARTFIAAWPIAFAFSMVISPVAFMISTKLTRLF